MHTIRLHHHADFEEWRGHARALLAKNIPPDQICWLDAASTDTDLFSGAAQDVANEARQPQEQSFCVPRKFIELAENIICHHDQNRLALLYRILWRLQQAPHLLHIETDADIACAVQMNKSIRRDMHKMTAFVRFREIAAADPASGSAARRKFVAWFEPDHYIVARTAGFFQRRFTDMDWIIATPKGSAAWDGTALSVSQEPGIKTADGDDIEAFWKTYFASTFNPARLKIKAMQTEMPKKYWKNMPEAALIPELIAHAETRVADMAAREPSAPRAFHHKIQNALRQERKHADD